MIAKFIIFLLVIIPIHIYATENIKEFQSNKYCNVIKDNLFINKQNSKYSYGYNLCFNKNKKIKNVEISVDFKPISGNIDQGSGIAWRIQNEYNYYVARFNPLENNFRLYYVKNGNRVQLKSAKIKLSKNYNTMKITHQGNNIKAYINDRLLLNYNDRMFKNSGYVGVWSKADASTLFTKILIKEIN